MIRIFTFFIIFFTLIIGNIYADLNDSLVAHYEFEGNANDSVGNKNGAEYGDIVYVEGKIGKAASFNGESYIKISNFTNVIDYSEDFSVCMWLNIQDYTDFTKDYFVTQRPIYVGKGFELLIFQKEAKLGEFDNDEFIPKNGLSSAVYQDWDCYSSDHTLLHKTFYHIVLSYDSDKKTSFIYINGQQVSEDKLGIDNDYDINTPKDFLCLGGRNRGTSTKCEYSSFNGWVDDLRIYSRKLSSSEIAELSNLGNETECSDSDKDGVIDIWDKCPETPQDRIIDNNGCRISCLGEGIYTEENMKSMIRSILQWGDIDNNGKIGLSEAINALWINSGVKKGCNTNNPELCLTENKCKEYGLWYDNSCHKIQTCSEERYEFCFSKKACESVGRYWCDDFPNSSILDNTCVSDVDGCLDL